MGYVKYNEDNVNIVNDRLYDINHSVAEPIRKKQAKLIHCPYCDKAFEQKEVLFSHTRNAHNIKRPIVLINDKVIENGEDLFVSSVISVIIHEYGFDDQIKINDKTIMRVADSFDLVDITDEVAESLSTRQSCSLSIGTFNTTIHYRSLKSINQGNVNLYINKWENDLAEGRSLSIEDINNPNLNYDEHYYLEGVFNYYVACQATGKDKTERYNEANSILKCFIPIDSFGLCIQKVIAFRLNWVHTLRMLCNDYDSNDAFVSVCCFFENSPCVINISSKGDEKKLYIENELQEIFDAIIDFTQVKYPAVKEYLDNHDPSKIMDDNLRDKILLLKSRLLMKEGNMKEAKFIFSQIRNEEFKF